MRPDEETNRVDGGRGARWPSSLAACGLDGGGPRARAAPAAAFNAGVGQGVQPVRRRRVARCGSPTPATGTRWTRPTPTTASRGTSSASTAGRSHVQARPGRRASKLVPDLAESLGEPSDDGKTWTYKLRDGLKFEDGTPVTSKDVKYGVERSLDKDDVPERPDLLQRLPRPARATPARTRTPTRTSSA